MKKVISITLALIMALSLSVTAFAATITAQTPSTDSNGVYQIGTAAELYGFAELVNGGETSANAVLTADIVVNENVLNESGELNSGDFVSWTPIGNTSNKYTGTFDGQGHTISGLYYSNSSVNYVGLFGFIDSGGKISNVGVVNSYLCGKNHVGSVCGNDNYGTITTCYNTCSVSGTGDCVGGVCGYNYYGTITDCYNAGKVSGSNRYVGGVCGENTGTITKCYNTGTVSGTSFHVGGVCGYSESGTITDCYNAGVVSGTSYFVGGVCGLNNNDSTISDCYNTGKVSGTSLYVGGVCASNTGTITNCYNTGEVSGDGYVGGVCGEIHVENDSYSTITISGCCNMGAVSGRDYVGGVCGGIYGENDGYSTITITMIGCCNVGTVSGTYYVGGVCGENCSTTIIGCYNSGTVEATGDYIGSVCGYNDYDGEIHYCYANSGDICGDDIGTVMDCAIYSDNKFADGTVLNLLNTALKNADSDVVFHQIIGTESYPVLFDDPTVTSYTVTIPEAIKIGEEVRVSATEVTLKRVETLTIAITETSEVDNAFKLRTTDGAELAYTVKNGENDVAINDAILTLGYTDSQGEATLNFVPTESAKFSGSYTGTVTFTVSVG